MMMMMTMTTTRVTRPRSRLNGSENQRDEAMLFIMHIDSVYYARASISDTDLGYVLKLCWLQIYSIHDMNYKFLILSVSF